jgi:stage II sporulation protein Q
MREEEKKRTSQESSFKRFFKKRWAFPAIYIASAAIILTAVLWYQTSNTNVAKDNKYDYNATDIAGKNNNPPAIEVNSALENIKWPLANFETASIQKPFYDVNGSDAEQEAALVEYGNSYQPNTGVDITLGNGETFDVLAALSGTVIEVSAEDTILGNAIVIQHDNNVVTQYQSVKDIKVVEGDKVKQGQAIAKAGQSLLNEEAGVHVHFEIRKDSTPVNPISFFDKPVSSVMVEMPAAKEDKAVEEQTSPEGTTETEGSVDTNKNAEGTGTPEEDKKDEGDKTDKKADENADSIKSKTNPS